MRHVFGMVGVLAAGILIVVSATMNWRFGYSLGRTELDGLVYASASAAADCLKALVPFFFFAAVRNRSWSQAAAAGLVGLVVTAYSLASALGHAALNRNDTTSHRQVEAQAYKDLREELKQARDRLSWIGSHRPHGAVAAEVESLKGERLWNRTGGCTQIEGKAARDYCRKLRLLESEVESAREAEKLASRVAEIQMKLSGLSGQAVTGDADPQAAVLARLLGLETDQVQFGLTIFVAILLEVGSGMGMYMAFSAWRVDDVATATEPPSAQIGGALQPVVPALPGPKNVPFAPLDGEPAVVDGGVIRFFEARVQTSMGATCPVTSLYGAYRAWCAEQGATVLALPGFVRELDELGVMRVKTDRGLLYVGLRVESPPLREAS